MFVYIFSYILVEKNSLYTKTLRCNHPFFKLAGKTEERSFGAVFCTTNCEPVLVWIFDIVSFSLNLVGERCHEDGTAERLGTKEYLQETKNSYYTYIVASIRPNDDDDDGNNDLYRRWGLPSNYHFQCLACQMFLIVVEVIVVGYMVLERIYLYTWKFKPSWKLIPDLSL